MSVSFGTVVRAFGNNAGIEVPTEALDQLGSGQRPRVRVQVDEYRFATTVEAMGGLALISLSTAHRDASGLTASEKVQVVLELDDLPAQIEVPPELAAALTDAGLNDVFAKLAPSRRTEYAREVSEARSAGLDHVFIGDGRLLGCWAVSLGEDVIVGAVPCSA